MKEEELVAKRLPRNLVLDLKKIEITEQSDRSTVLRKLLHTEVADWKKEHAARLYAEGKVSLGRAAMDSGGSVREMIGYLKAKKIPDQYDVEDLEEDVRSFYKRVGAEASLPSRA
jgi:predicted HTH domain antitoxin